MKAVIDLETVSLVDLTKVGQLNYAAHPSTFIAVLSFLWESQVYTIVNPKTQSVETDQDTLSVFMRLYTNIKETDTTTLIAHNAPFEKAVLDKKLDDFVKDLGFKVIKKPNKYKFVDTMTLASVFRSPSSLDVACSFFKLEHEKDAAGKALMKKTCQAVDIKPPKMQTTTNSVDTHWIKYGKGLYFRGGIDIYKRIADYCAKDVLATNGLYELFSSKKKIADLGEFLPHIKEGMAMTLAMNERGVGVDIDYFKKLEKHKNTIFNHLDGLISDELNVPSAGMKAKILKALNAKDYKIEKLGKDDIKAAVKRNKNEDLNYLVEEFSRLNKTSLNKVASGIKTLHGDRLYNMFKFSGAYATGRWTSYGVQLQNLPRPTCSLQEVESFMDDPKADPIISPDTAVSAIRAAFVPSPGYKFFIADLSQIELRRTLDKCGYHKELKRLSEGHDLYKVTAAEVFKKKVEDISPVERYVGKTLMLAAQYGQGGFRLKQTLFTQGDIIISLKEAEKYVMAYQKKYKNIVKMWNKYDAILKEAFISKKPLKVKLATGRLLDYGKISVRRKKATSKAGHTYMKKEYVYFDGRMYKSLWGGNIYQHIIQAECRDIMMLKMNDLHKKGARIVMTVHDEVIVEVKKDKKLDNLRKMWYNSGRREIKKYFPKMRIDSDCVFSHRYFSH